MRGLRCPGTPSTMSTMLATWTLVIVVLLYHLDSALGLPHSAQADRRLHKRQAIVEDPTDSAEARLIRPKLRFHEIVPPARVAAPLFSSPVLECQAAGTPPPTMHWLKNGRRIQRSEEDNAVVDEEVEAGEGGTEAVGLSSTVSRLYIDCVTPEDEGVYTCVAETRYQRIATDTKLKLQGRDPASTGNCKFQRKRTELGGAAKPARIVMHTANMLEMEGGDVAMFCRASGSPAPRVSWRDNSGNLITDSEKFQVLPRGDLIIRAISFLEDMGVYTCEAANVGGVVEAESFLYPTAQE